MRARDLAPALSGVLALGYQGSRNMKSKVVGILFILRRYGFDGALISSMLEFSGEYI